MVEQPVTSEPRTVTALLDRLSSARSSEPAGIAFDADGTLWSGDVGEDVFETTTERGLLREDARAELAATARRFGVPMDGGPSEIAGRLYAAYRAGTVPELVMCEVMTWAYAGFGVDELRERARETFSDRKLGARVRAFLGPIFDWARTEDVRVVVVSASPRLIVAEALSATGIAVDDLAGAVALEDAGTIRPGLLGKVPYAGEKRVAGERLLAGRQWLASFGDNAFDVEMLRRATVGVAVHPKPALRARLADIDGVWLLE